MEAYGARTGDRRNTVARRQMATESRSRHSDGRVYGCGWEVEWSGDEVKEMKRATMSRKARQDASVPQSLRSADEAAGGASSIEVMADELSNVILFHGCSHGSKRDVGSKYRIINTLSPARSRCRNDGEEHFAYFIKTRKHRQIQTGKVCRCTPQLTQGEIKPSLSVVVVSSI